MSSQLSQRLLELLLGTWKKLVNSWLVRPQKPSQRQFAERMLASVIFTFLKWRIIRSREKSQKK